MIHTYSYPCMDTQDVNASRSKTCPQLYKAGIDNMYFKWRMIVVWLIVVTLESLIFFFLPITCAFMYITICHTKGISTNTIPCSFTKGCCLNLSISKHQSFNYLRDDKTSCLPMILELAIGMPIMCIKNNFGPKEVANGTLGHVIGYQLPKIATTHHQVIDESFGNTILVSSKLLEIVFIKLLGHDQVLDLEFPLGIIGIHPILEQDVFVKLPNQSFIISIEQIPIILAFVIDKCQGLTLLGTILGPLLHLSQRNLKKNDTLYVVLSQVKHLIDLQVLEPLSHSV